jgi:hypothetical protein
VPFVSSSKPLRELSARRCVTGPFEAGSTASYATAPASSSWVRFPNQATHRSAEPKRPWQDATAPVVGRSWIVRAADAIDDSDETQTDLS